MAKIISVETHEYINSNIEIYAKNKIGQYSKYLDKTPIFVKYYHVNSALSRQDTGTGNIESDLGSKSPTRFNKIVNYPLYNVPTLNPDLIYDETGMDIDIDCSDIGLLPGTLKPSIGDYFIISFPGIKEFLFRVTNVKYSTIQSNDFYIIDADVKRIGDDLENKYMTGQVVEEYLTIFENIGTEDRCFVRTTDIPYINSLMEFTDTIKDYYMNAFYNKSLNSFTYLTPEYSTCGYPIYRYDIYLEKFISMSNIFYDPDSIEALVLVPNDDIPDKFLMKFNESLYNAILRKDSLLLKPYSYYITKPISIPYSVYRITGVEAESIDIFNYKDAMPDIPDINPVLPCQTESAVWYKYDPLPNCIPTWTIDGGNEYFPSEFLLQLKGSAVFESDDYMQLIIYNYLNNINMEYDKKYIVETLDNDNHTFYYLPIVIYILQRLYKDYFKTDKPLF